MFDFKAEFLFVTNFCLGASFYECGFDGFNEVTTGNKFKTVMQRKFNTESYQMLSGLGKYFTPSPYGKVIGNTYYWYSDIAENQFNLTGEKYTYVAF